MSRFRCDIQRLLPRTPSRLYTSPFPVILSPHSHLHLRLSSNAVTRRPNKMSTIPEIAASPSFPKEEEKILQFWNDIDAFQTSLKLAEGRPPFSFYDGPPFATGRPHYGHLLAGTIKDVVTRYAASTGHYVERRFGWDTHGLPVEHEIDKKLNIKGPNDVMAMGIDKYNAECRAIVMKYAGEWETTVNRMGRWIDFKNDYKTMNLPFMESVWWVFKQLFDKEQVYRGFKIMPFSTGVHTPLSNMEATQNYKDVTDPAVVISFPLVSDPSVALLAWTTTPWTLPSNLGLTVHPEFEYVKIKDGETGAIWILLEGCLGILYKDVKKAKYTILEKIKGSDLKGLEYEPVFDFFSDRKGRAFKVMADTYVTADSGTGIVHCAPTFGEDDYRVAVANDVVTGEGDLPNPVDATGCFTSEITDYVGVYVKDADKQIQKDLKTKGRLIRQSQITHSYPFCWRSDTPLIYKAVPGWFVRVSNINDKLLANNKKTYWVPETIKEKKFHNWLENARDWNISRNRYWGTPIPLWVSEDYEEVVAIGSVEELTALSGVQGITDLHRDKIDHITIPSKKGKGDLRRIPEVFDCWFESGSMPYAQQHYPFENEQKFNGTFPADFIAEGIDQTRGWFYTLMVLSTHLFDTPPFKNVVVNGLILASDGKKMSKRLKNYPDPNDVMHTYGADVLRLYLIGSPAVRAESLRFREEGVKELVAKVLLPWYNAYRFFFAQLALLKKEHNVDFQYNPEMDLSGDRNVMDKWILASTQTLIDFVRAEMAAYRLYTVTPRLLNLIDSLTNWYVRFNRKRLKGDNGPAEAVTALNVLFEVLFTLSKLMAPFTPFIVETMYQNLKTCMPATKEDTRSIHFLPFPEPKSAYFNADIERAVGRMQTVIESGRYIRDQKTLPLKTPLRELVIIHPDAQFHSDVKALEDYIVDELNIRTVTVTSEEAKYGIKYKLIPDWKTLGGKLKKDLPKVKTGLATVSQDDIKKYVSTNKLVVNGIELGEGDLQVTRYFDDEGQKGSTYHAHGSGDVLVILDTALDQSLINEGLAREVINRVQRSRKEAKLQPTDDILYYIKIVSDPNNELQTVLQDQKDFLLKSLKQGVENIDAKKSGADVVLEIEQEVSNSKFVLTLVRA
ncbi:tRNA synthetases class I-domain-containing protein [Fimicolochytrium jonesii]|uniref:tRNA synthetases class I-domain-containing protein n=1 Tax=Fimicolochytrium jonesii TaxID=1396493 RepID=UPI0022FEE588|nr:tRNA synthetases class I-domain-containing protein [Fimicolochytrium jonesii]KAI8819915.1 tRNA synthetases class I-domain-containing protein [Fimicolochytrium jonesii]